MRYPVKINQGIVPAFLRNSCTCKGDPRLLLGTCNIPGAFERSVSAVKIGTTWKSTLARRHVETDNVISSYIAGSNNKSILDVGVSTGTTSLELIRRLDKRFERFYATDVLLEIGAVRKNDSVYFYYNKNCIMWANLLFVVYNDYDGAIFPFNLLARNIIKSGMDKCTSNMEVVSLINPELRKIISHDSRIVVCKYDVFMPWDKDPVDIIKCANILNKAYFSDLQINNALNNFYRALDYGGLLILTDNRSKEKVSVYKKKETGRFIEELCLNGGSEIRDHVLALNE